MVKKLSKEELTIALHKDLIACTEEEIRFAFSVLGFQLKEARFSENVGHKFEVHWKRSFIVRITTTPDNVLIFENEFVDFGDEKHNIAVGKSESLIETLVLFVDMFTQNLLQSAGYELKFEEATSPFSNLEEAREYLGILQKEARKLMKNFRN